MVNLCSKHTEANKHSRAVGCTFYSNSPISDSLEHSVGCLRETTHFAAANFVPVLRINQQDTQPMFTRLLTGITHTTVPQSLLPPRSVSELDENSINFLFLHTDS